MAGELDLRGGTATQNATFVGGNREVTVDDTNHTLIVHDGSTTGGFPLTRGPLSATAAGHIVTFTDTTGRLLQDSGKSLPSGTIVGTTDTQTLQNKTLDNTNALTLKAGNLTVQDDTDTTKQVRWSLSGITTASLRTITVPDASFTLVGTTLIQTLTNKTFDASLNTLSNITTAMFAANVVDTDGTFAANSNTRVPSQAATKSYLATYIAAQDVEIFKGAIDCSTNPNYPAADAGNVYRVSVAGKIGGASGAVVEVNDRLECYVDSSAAGTFASVGGNWLISQVNIDGAVVGPASATSGNIATFSGTSGKLIQDGGKALPSGAIVGTTDTQTLTNKTLDNTNIVTHKTDRFTLQDSADTTKQLLHSLSGFTTGTTRTVTWPDANITVVGTTQTQTLTNKTLDNTTTLTIKAANSTLQDATDTTKQAKWSLSGIATGTTRTYTLPDASTTLVGTDTTQTLTNKTADNTNTVTLKDTLFTLQDDGDTTKQARFQLSGIATGTLRTYTVPDASTTLVGTDTTQTLTNKTLDNTSTITIKAANSTLQDATDTTKQAKWSLSGITTGTTRTYTLPDASTTVVGTDTTQTLSNKTFSDTIKDSVTPSAGWNIDCNGTNTGAIVDNDTYTFAVGAGLIIIRDASNTGNMALFMVGGSLSTLVGQPGTIFANSVTAGKASITYAGSQQYVLTNKTGVTSTYRLAMIRLDSIGG